MIEKTGNIFHISAKDISYVMALVGGGRLVHSYFGKKIRVSENYKTEFLTGENDWSVENKDDYSLRRANKYAEEYPSYGYMDLHLPAYEVENPDGNSISELLYKEHKIYDGVYDIKGMPSLFQGDSRAQTIEITLEDKYTGLNVILIYTVFEEYNVIARSVKFVNTSDKPLKLKSAYSSCFAINSGEEYDVIYFPGTWGRERQFTRSTIKPGMNIDLGSLRGISSHEMNPFVMIADKNADENNGNVYSVSLVYSGNHSTAVNSDHYNHIRIMQGINPFGFEWTLNGGEDFDTPQSIMCFSDCGIGGISRELSDLYRNNLCRSKWAKKERPILINNWEATYFDFNEEKIVSIAKKAKETGIELFVLDDGWFGKRNDANSSLGDWYTDLNKLPNGIEGIAKKVTDLGIGFGLWFEPEMISPDSDLFRAHPDWAIGVNGRTQVQSRLQYILDLSRDEVCGYIIKAVCDILEKADISYVKWDMNRPMTEMPYPGYNHKYVLGYYKIMSAITERFPEVLFEGCCSGGGRFDAGVLAYMPQIWTSDNSDAIARLKIQYSTSIGYPASSISAHVTASPNHQNGRVTPLKTSGDVAYNGVFGYELDITKMSDEEIEIVKEQIKRDKELRGLIQNGDMYRLASPFEGNYCSWETAAKDKSEAFVMICRIMSVLGWDHYQEKRIFLKGLDPDSDYIDKESGMVYGGDELMYRGIVPEYENTEDFSTSIMHLMRCKKQV